MDTARPERRNRVHRPQHAQTVAHKKVVGYQIQHGWAKLAVHGDRDRPGRASQSRSTLENPSYFVKLAIISAQVSDIAAVINPWSRIRIGNGGGVRQRGH